jgi:hypothetical protein
MGSNVQQCSAKPDAMNESLISLAVGVFGNECHNDPKDETTNSFGRVHQLLGMVRTMPRCLGNQ